MLSAEASAERRTGLAVPSGLFEAAIGFVAVTAAAFSHGAYYPTAWGLFAVAGVWVIAVRLALGNARLGGLEVAALALLLALAGWVAASSLWGIPERAFLETERIVLYVTTLAAVCLVLTRSTLPSFLTGVWAAVSAACGYGVLTRLLPERLGLFDPIAGYRLSEPLGYWNGLGVFAASGALLGLGLAARSPRPAIRPIAAASLPVLFATLYFTFSRGAWIALAVGLLAAVAIDPHRLQLVTNVLVLAPAVVITLAVAYRSPALNRIDASSADASREGHRLALVVAVAAGLSALVALVVQRLEQRAPPRPQLRRTYSTTLVVCSLAALLIVFAKFGSPPTLVSRAYDAFAAPPPVIQGGVNERLFNLSGSNRLLQWRVAWDAYERKPILGSGAGTYEQSWNELRPTPFKIRDAHSLYLESLSELGPVGLGLLLTALGIPAFAAIRARRFPVVPAAFGAYVTFIVHAGVDWDWELPAVTLLGLLCAATLLVAARGERVWSLSGYARAGVVAASLALAAFSLVGLVGNRALADGDAALNAGQIALAADRARAALRWTSWSAQAHRLLAEAQLAEGDIESARRNFREAVAADPRDWKLWFALAQTTSGPEGDRAFAEARRLNPLGPELQSDVPSAIGP